MITLEQIREAIKAEVALQGDDFVYVPVPGQGCVYRTDNGPSCLIGRAVARLKPEVRLPEGKAAQDALKGIAEPMARAYANQVQPHQDFGVAWGKCVSLADAELEGRIQQAALEIASDDDGSNP